MKFSKRWKLAGIIATEIRFKGYLESNPTNLSRVKENPEKIAKQIKSASRVNALLSSMLIVSLTIVTMGVVVFDVSLGSADIRMALGFGIYLLFCFVILFFLNLTPTTGFFVSGAMRLPATLPLSKTELEHFSFFAFIRIFIAPALLLSSVYPIITLWVYGPLSGLAAFIGCVSTVFISMGALLGFAKWFHIRTHSADESRLSTLVRLAATFGLVFGFLSVYMIANILPAVIQFIADFASTAGSTSYTALSLIFPFSFGLFSSTVTFGSTFSIETGVLAILGACFYCLVAVVAYRRAGSALREVSIGGVTKGRIGLLKEIKLTVTTPLRAMVAKDLKLATKNIGSAFVFVVPLFLVFMIYPMIAFWGGGVRSGTVLTALEYANLFAGISTVSVLMFDSAGASIQEGLPQSTQMTLRAKTAIAFPIYMVSIILITIIVALQPLFSPVLLLIPLAQLPAGYYIPTIVGGVLYKYQGGGRAVAISITGNTGLVMLSAAIVGAVGIVPLVGYGLTMILTGNHILCLLVQVSIAVLLAIVSNRYVSRLLKD